MKLSCFFTLLTLHVSASVFSQNAKIDLNLKRAGIEDLLHILEKKTEYKFVFSSSSIPLKSINFEVKNQLVSEILKEALDGTGLTYKVLDNNLIAITKMENAGQDHLGGVILDEKGLPLPGVTIFVKNWKELSLKAQPMTTSDINGRWSLDIQNKDALLSFSFMGYVPQEILATHPGITTIKMAMSERTLDELVILVPYGSQKKSAFVGSETTLNREALENQRVTSFSKALDGLVPGLVATSGGGGPGSNADIQIRGVGSVSAGSGPLYVLDGMPFNGSIESISIDDIESVTVLKDASSTALYGSRGANGVIMVSTKKGNGRLPKISANVRFGTQNRAISEYDRVNQQEYYELMWEATRNKLTAGDFSKVNDLINEQASKQLFPSLAYNSTNMPNDQIVLPNGKFNPQAQLLWDDNWNKELTQQPFKQDYNVNVAGGTSTGNYFISLGYIQEPGIYNSSKYDRYTARVSTNLKPKDWLDIGLNLDGALGFKDYLWEGGNSTYNPFYYGRQMGPIYPVWQRDSQGGIVRDPLTGAAVYDWGNNKQMGTRPYAADSNLVGSTDLDTFNSENETMNGSTYLNILLTPELTFRSTIGGNVYNNNDLRHMNSVFGSRSSVGGSTERIAQKQLSYTFNQVLQYDKTIGELHVDALVGHENYFLKNTQVSASRTGFAFPGTIELGNAAVMSGALSAVNNLRIEGYFSKLNLTFQNKYLLSSSFRRDGNSRFFSGNTQKHSAQWGNFWSLGGGWRISQEEILKDVSWINELKLKASFGIQGNESLPSYYAWQGLYKLGWNNASNPGSIIGSLPNEDLTWEKSKSLNIGADFEFLERRLSGSFEWYSKQSDDLLFSVPLPGSTGITSINRNVGSMYNRGLDVSLNFAALRQSNFKWDIGLNLSHFKNQITKLPPENKKNGIISGNYKLNEGNGIYDFWLREFAGVDPQNGDALFYTDVLDASGKPTGARETTNNINNASYYFSGSAIPNFSGGLQNRFTYKNLEFSFLTTFSQGGKVYDGNYAALMHSGSYGTHWHQDILNRWQKPGDITDIPRVQNGLNTQNGVSTKYLFDGSYINIKNISLSYRLPKTWLGKFDAQHMSFFGNIDNVYLFNKHKGLDPQFSLAGGSDWMYVPVRTFTFGISLTL